MDIRLIPWEDQRGPIFFPEELPVGRFVSMRLLEKHTSGGKTAVAWLIEFDEKVHSKRVIVKETARMADGMLGAVRGACIQFGDLENYKDKIEFENQMVDTFVGTMTREDRKKMFSKYCNKCFAKLEECDCEKNF